MKPKFTQKKLDSLLRQYYQQKLNTITIPPLNQQTTEKAQQTIKDFAPARNRLLGVHNLAYALLFLAVLTPAVLFQSRSFALEIRLNRVFQEIGIEQKIPDTIVRVHEFFQQHYFGRSSQ